MFLVLVPFFSLIFSFKMFIKSYKTSGASETTLVKLFSRISRAIGPKIRVPLGLFSELRITAALSSKRISIPFLRRIDFFVRTTTARTISDRLTAIRGKDSLTTPIIMSPILAYFLLPPKTRIHKIFLLRYYPQYLKLFEVVSFYYL